MLKEARADFVVLRLFQHPGLQLGHRQGLPRHAGVGALGVGQGFQPLLHRRIGRGVEEGQGGFEARHVGHRRVVRHLRGLVEQGDRLLDLVLVQPDAGLLHQDQRLVTAGSLLGRGLQLGEGLVRIALPQGVEGGGVDLRGLGGLLVAPGLVAPPAQGREQGGDGRAHEPGPEPGEGLDVSFGAELLLDLFEDVGHARGAPGALKGGANLATRRPGRNGGSSQARRTSW